MHALTSATLCAPTPRIPRYATRLQPSRRRSGGRFRLIRPSRNSSVGFSGYFDTRIGHKREAAAYERIRESISRPVGEFLFFSDIGKELDVALARHADLLADAGSQA